LCQQRNTANRSVIQCVFSKGEWISGSLI
jgi:hypothetical protein